MLERTIEFLRSSDIVQFDDSCFSFGYGPNMHGGSGVEAVVAFFGPTFVAQQISGGSELELFVTRAALRQIDQGEASRAIVELLENDFSMFSVRPVTRSALEQVVAVFLEEMGECCTYSNTQIYPVSREGDCLGAWTPVTRSSRDTFVCAINAACVSFWVYSDDE